MTQDERQTIKVEVTTRVVNRLIRKQVKLFPENVAAVLPELDLMEAERVADRVKSAVGAHCDAIEVAGSLRRRKTRVHDVDFVVAAKSDAEWQKLSEELRRMRAKLSCSGSSVIKALLPVKNCLFKVDFYRAKPSTFGVHLLIRTGSADHNMWLAGYAISKGMRLKYSEGLIKDDAVIAGESEKGVFEALGLPYPSPSEREIVEYKPVWMALQKP
jgi:DNA polymerase (family 10)